MFVPSVLARADNGGQRVSPNDKLGIAGIGTGGQTGRRRSIGLIARVTSSLGRSRPAAVRCSRCPFPFSRRAVGTPDVFLNGPAL